jgi:hypothetical protein
MPRFEGVIVQQPRYALVTPRFRFRALASFAGRASLGGDREVAMACLVAGRLAASMLDPYTISQPDSAARSAAAKQWFASLALPSPIRSALGHLADAVASGKTAATAAALEKLVTVAGKNMDEASASELRSVRADLSAPPEAAGAADSGGR